VPIFVRPVREQLEHDRLIRFLQARYKRKFDVAINVGDEQLAPIKLGPHTFFPDLVVTEGKRLAGVVEVETGESVNNLEAMAQWVHFSRARVPFHLYVPVGSYDVAKRLCEANQVRVTEMWTYRPVLDGFDLVRVAGEASAQTQPPAPRKLPGQKPVSKPAAKTAAKPTPKKSSKPASKVGAKPAKKAHAKPVKKASKPTKSKPARKSGKR
jgi:hypothetical protein